MSALTPVIHFSDVSYQWPDLEKEGTAESAAGRPVFEGFNVDIPGGFISLTGPNGTGKSTFMLLAGGRILPNAGRIDLAGINTRELCGEWADKNGKPGPGLTPEIEHKRNLVCSFLYQNMEFEPQDGDSASIGSLLEYVYSNGGHCSKNEQYLLNVVQTFEIELLRNRKLDAVSKGEIQRILLAFSALYGSRVLMMDEPIFAMEQYQKERALEFFKDMQLRTGTTVLVSLHELALTRKYADTVLLFYPDHRIDMGSCAEILTKEALEDAYGVPAAMLYDTERLVRNTMIEQEAVRNNR